MGLLKDSEIVPLVERATPIIKNVDKPSDWYTSKSPVQPSSIDLHIGKIFLPIPKKFSIDSLISKIGFLINRKAEAKEVEFIERHALKHGETVVVETKEEFDLTGDIGGFGFPPSRVSRKGILMTNPGHIDPGFRGKITFTVINMAKESYILASGDEIFTVLLFSLNGKPESDWKSRKEKEGSSSSQMYPNQKELSMLSPDFMDINQRAENIAKREIHRASFGLAWMKVWGTLIVGIIPAIAAYYFSIQAQNKDLRKELEPRLVSLEKKADIQSFSDDIGFLKTEVAAINKKLGEITTPSSVANSSVQQQEIKK